MSWGNDTVTAVIVFDRSKESGKLSLSGDGLVGLRAATHLFNIKHTLFSGENHEEASNCD